MTMELLLKPKQLHIGDLLFLQDLEHADFLLKHSRTEPGETKGRASASWLPHYFLDSTSGPHPKMINATQTCKQREASSHAS